MEGKIFPELFADFVQQAGHPEVTLDAKGDAELFFDQDVVVNIHYNPEVEEVLVYALVTSIDGVPQVEALLARMMRANYLWEETMGFTLSLDHTSDELVLADRKPGDFFTTPDQFGSYLEAMLTVLYTWRKVVVEQYRDELKEQAGSLYQEDAGEAEESAEEGASQEN